MINKERLKEIIEEYLKDSALFLVELKVGSGNQIHVFLDGDEGVPISSCIEISRHIESFFDRDQEDFELEVSSVGISRPLSMPRQFKKNIGREIVFLDPEGKKVLAKLLEADDTGVTIEKQVKKKSKKDKNTQPEDPVQKLEYSHIKDAIVQVSFKSKQ